MHTHVRSILINTFKYFFHITKIMEDLITPSSTATATSSLDDIESIDTDLLYNLLVQHRIQPIVAQRFKSY
jgi:hypothetical protein